MKKYLSTILTLLCLSLLMMLLSGSDCKKKSTTEPGADDLVGTWVLDSVTVPGLGTFPPATLDMGMTIVIKADGTFTRTEFDGTNTTTYTGTWTATTNILTITEEGETETLPYTLDGNNLTINTTEEIDVDNDGNDETVQMTLVFTKQ